MDDLLQRQKEDIAALHAMLARMDAARAEWNRATAFLTHRRPRGG
jgi:hypothetical protein